MEITKVKKSGSGFVINDTMHVPNAAGNRHYQAIQDWVTGDVGRFIEDEFTAEEIAANALREAKENAKAQVKAWVSEGEDMILEVQVILAGYVVDTAQGLANMAAFAPIQELLKNGSLNLARDMITALDLTGTSFTAEDKTEILAILDAKIVVLIAV